QPNTIAGRAFNWVTYGPGSMRSMSPLGSERNLETITIEDLQAWKQNYLTPQLSSLRIVGSVDEADVLAALDGLTEQWQPVDVTLPAPEQAVTPTGSKVYFYDVPGASQSVFRFGYPALKRTDAQYDVNGVMNYRLGGGGFASRLTQELREGKGYTYGIGSSFSGTDQVGTFGIFSGVRSNVTLEAASLVRDIMRDYAATYTQNDLDVTQSFFTKSQARRFESLGAKLNVLSDIADYDLPYDYVARQIEKVEALTVEDMQALAADNIRPDAMNYIIVGDAETQLSRLADLGFGEPVLINEEIDSLTE
ncbi:MAG: insulinase family protein, partial [Pseudomonadota bacterium]